MRAFLLLLTLAGCAATTGSSMEERERAGLAENLAERVEGEPRSCVSQTSGQTLNVVDERTVVYNEGRTIWVNKLRSECPGLDPIDPIIIETHGGQYCNGDRFRTQQPGTSVPGPVCFLGDWTPYRMRD